MGRKYRDKNPAVSIIKCRSCRQLVVVDPCGTVRTHNIRGDEGLVPCPDSGQKVAPPSNEEDHASGQMTAAPAATTTRAARKPTTVKKRATCPVCNQVVRRENREPKDHDYEGRRCSGEVATCKVCKRKLPVRASDGRMTSHSAGDKTCAGSGRSPYEGRSPKFMQGITRVVSGGLSSTRRRH